MKSFRFKYSPLVWVLLALVLVLSLAGLGWNVYNLITFISIGSPKITTSAIMLAITLALTIYVISLMAFSRYLVKNGNVYACFGLIRFKNNASDIIQFTHFKKSDKLVAYFKDEKYAVILISHTQYDQFISRVREINPKILYDSQIDGEEQP